MQIGGRGKESCRDLSAHDAVGPQIGQALGFGVSGSLEGQPMGAQAKEQPKDVRAAKRRQVLTLDRIDHWSG